MLAVVDADRNPAADPTGPSAPVAADVRFAGDCPERLDRALAAAVDGVSRSHARRLIAAGAVFVDGKRCRIASRLVTPGSRLRVSELPPAGAIEPLTILHEDRNYVAVNKPAGMPSAPTTQAAAGTALEVLRSQDRGRPHRLWLVHRLDAATSGALVFACNANAAAALSAAFRERRVAKHYVALVEGIVRDDDGTIDLAIERAGRRARTSPTGKPAATHWKVIERRGDRTLLALTPEGGRMHQLRVHLAAIGHPIVGDVLYGGPRAERLMLHAAELVIPASSYDRSDRTIRIAAPPPAELNAGQAQPR